MSLKKHILTAFLKNKIEVTTIIEIDFEKNWLESSRIIEKIKRDSLLKIQNELHKKIATLHIDDVIFEIINPTECYEKKSKLPVTLPPPNPTDCFPKA